MSDFDKVPIGARVRVTDVVEGVVRRRLDSTIVLDDGLWIPAPGELIDRWIRTIEVLEPPRPEEPTGLKAVVLARSTLWVESLEQAREPFYRDSDGAWVWNGGFYTWADLTDITVVHPGGIE